jgi:hypothetical protein
MTIPDCPVSITTKEEHKKLLNIITETLLKDIPPEQHKNYIEFLLGLNNDY